MEMSIIAKVFVSKLLNGLAALVEDEVAMLWGVKGEIKRLQKGLGTINAVLADAESKKIQSKAIDDWLRNLKDVMYDADDILDQIEAEKSKAAVSLGRQPCSCLFSCSCFGKTVFAHQIGRRIKSLNHRLDDILTASSKFNLQLVSADRGDHRSTSRVGRKTSPVAEPDIVGSNIQKDTDKLVKLLIKEDSRENILVYAIVGTGGIGKTTLARKIFNDDRITTKFPMKLWVCVSKDFDEISLLKEIITHAEGDSGGASSRAQLEPKVANTVTNKKFLLVLDDMWDPNVWNDLLRNPLQSGATGSRVLVTTRNQRVALQMKAVESHQVAVLSAEDGWALLLKKVVLSGQEGDIEHLMDIGKKIVEKCGGLPLAIKTIGGVLSTKSRTKMEWERVLKTLSSNAWSSSTHFPEEVQPALWLSYEDLPSHLKQCFLYCSLFPEDYEFDRDKLIYYWISEGFIHEEGEVTLEELGEDCYWELIQRSFLQPHPCTEYKFPKCTVHDLLWSLARFLAGDENLAVKDGVDVPINSSSVKTRRLRGRVTEENRQAFIGALEGHKSLRTLLPRLASSHVMQENDANNLIKKTPRLRVLDFSYSSIKKLPDSLGTLIHLRYLDLSFSGICELPESIGNLVNLQFLILQSCESLRSLPKGIGKLHNLRCLDLFGAVLEGIPIEIANLHRLNTLTGFVVRNNRSDSGWCTLEHLRSLEKLKELSIQKLERALNEVEVGRVNALRGMLQLKVLSLWREPPTVDDDDGQACGYSEEVIKKIEKIFEVTLCPPPHLESLSIRGFFGLHFPSWIASSSTDLLLSDLRRLELIGCDICLQLPSLGKLPNLDSLWIHGASAVKKIGTEFLGQESDCSRDQGCRMQIFPKLTTLVFEHLDDLEEWEWEVKDDDRLIAIPKLEELTLYACPKLRSLPSGLVHHATALTMLKITMCDSLKAIRGFSSIKHLKISYNPNIDVVSELPSLQTLSLINPQMRALPEGLHGGQPDFLALNKLEILGTDQLLRRCLKDGLDWPKIELIPYVNAKDFYGSGYISKSPSAFSTNLTDYVEDHE